MAEGLSVDQVLPAEEVSRILATEDFFGIRDVADGKSPYDPLSQKYSQFFLKARNQKISYSQAVDYAMRSSFALAFGMEQLIQADLGQHEAMGALLPSLHITVGDGLPIGISNAFQGLFGFLMPQNWLALRNSTKRLEVAELGVLKGALDSLMNIKLVFIDLHRIALNAEILSFYFSHLQLLERAKCPSSKHDAQILKSLYASIGIRLSDALNLIGIHHNNLARAMTIIQDANDRFSAESIRIQLMRDFPDTLPPIDSLGDVYESQERFVQTTLARSVEVKMVQALADIAKKKVGIAAFGNILENESVGRNLNLGIHFGYATLPRILTARSKQRKSEIDVSRSVLSFLDIARRAYGNYKNARRTFVQASESLRIHRELFYPELEKLLESEQPAIDDRYLVFFQNLLAAEIATNDALHDGLRRRVTMSRYLAEELEAVEGYLPTQMDIDSAIDKIRHGSLYRKTRTVSLYAQHLRKTKDLRNFLDGRALRKQWVDFGGETVSSLVAKHIEMLLLPKSRSKKFFLTLRSYIEANGLSLSPNQKTRIDYLCRTGRLARFIDKLGKRSPVASS